ncbi:MAG: alkaline phosphatase family protein, partial [Candidatus Aminicenantes bacterium]|nr:alkaline phosphatase family protein [Candidatus Aminicenantes bacterium]
MKRRDFIQKSLLVTSALAAAHCGIQTTEKTRVVILGFDGANWPTIDPLIKKGKLPFLKQLKEDSAWAYFKTCKPTKSNVVWSSIASGKNMMKHGIMDFAFLRKSGIKVPYSKSERMAPMIWQILDEYRRRSMVLNWWVSHPPDPINGVMISDYFRLVFRRNPDKINEFEESIHPASYFRLFRKMVERNNYRAILKQTGLADFPALFYEKYPGGNIKRTVTLKNYPGFVQQDDLIERASWYLYNKEKFDFFATY